MFIDPHKQEMPENYLHFPLTTSKFPGQLGDVGRNSSSPGSRITLFQLQTTEIKDTVGLMPIRHIWLSTVPFSRATTYCKWLISYAAIIGIISQ